MQMAIDVAGFTPGRGRPAAPGDGVEAQPGADGAAEGPAVRRHGRAGHHRRRRRRDLHEDGGVRRTTASPSRTAVSSATSSTRRRGSSSTSRRRSARRCSTRSRWGSGARTRWCRTPAATGWWCTRPTSTRRRRLPRWSRAPTVVGGVAVRLGLSGRCAASATSWPQRSRPAGRTRRSKIWCAACRRCTWCSSRRWPPPGCSSECFGLERREALWAVGAAVQSRPDRLRGRGHRHACRRAAGHGPGGDRGRRPVGHRRVARRPSHRSSCATSWPSRAWSPRRGCGTAEPRSRVLVAGIVTHRQRPMTAQGTTFMNLEDETGLMNIVVSKGCWARLPQGRPRSAGAAGPRPARAQRGRRSTSSPSSSTRCPCLPARPAATSTEPPSRLTHRHASTS